ncbi:MAG: FtsX-like permease family protein [Planctomycetaceae bacterium]|nr:MAG: FtsX-like permease family protein [Planctomycetaceae bacterium]
MLLWTILKVGVKSLWGNKMRSLLAMLGIIIGVAAVISMLALGSGAQKQVLERFATMGTNLLIVQPAQRGSMGVMSGSQQNLTVEDAMAILEQVDGIEQASPAVSGNWQIKYGGKNSRPNTTGASVTYFQIRNFQIEKGRTFTEAEVEQKLQVAVLGPTTATDLFGENDPIGEDIKIKGRNYRVVGVTKAKGSQGWFDPDDMAIVPYTVAMERLAGIRYLREIDLQVKDGQDSNAVEAAVTALLRKRHRLTGDAPDDFRIRNQADMIQMASEATGTFKLLLGGVAAISLLVGGIGIMNIMLVSVTERTREIGIRKAIGAKERSIMMQFLLESVVISGLGGVIGVLLGIGGAKLMPLIMPLPCVVEVFSVVLSLGFSAGVGIVFGIYPAWRASGLDPVEALRYE